MHSLLFLNVVLLILLNTNLIDAEEIQTLPDNWNVVSPRPEIKPLFSYDEHAGFHQQPAYIIQHDSREGLDGWIQKSFTVTGGEYISFHALRKLENVPQARRSALVRILWKNEQGKMVSLDISEDLQKQLGHTPTAEPEHPQDGETNTDGWTTVSGIYRVPSKAVTAVVELHLQWAPGGKVCWSNISLQTCEPPAPRKVKLAAVHFRPGGKTPLENCEQFIPLLEEAARQKVDLAVLGETITYVNTKKLPHEIAESVPGPTTEFFSRLAAKFKLHLVFSIYESDRHLVYNSAVLIDPDGKLVGKYRKVTLPHGEVEKGVAPGNEYPVFNTKLGKIGMMICYDGFYPEVARELSNRGAEIIAWPVWGCNPLLAKARACENHIYLVSSTYMEPQHGWMISAVFDQTGNPVASAENFGNLAIAEVDLNQPYRGPYNLGDFHSMIPRHRPEVKAETP